MGDILVLVLLFGVVLGSIITYVLRVGAQEECDHAWVLEYTQASLDKQFVLHYHKCKKCLRTKTVRMGN